MSTIEEIIDGLPEELRPMGASLRGALKEFTATNLELFLKGITGNNVDGYRILASRPLGAAACVEAAIVFHQQANVWEQQWKDAFDMLADIAIKMIVSAAVGAL